jgi:hypothetical protein
MTWGFLWLMVALKVPIALLLWLVWWAIHADPEPDSDSSDGSDGGSKVRDGHRSPLPRHPRHRGPHGAPLPSPPRVRTVARARTPVDR